FLDPLIDARQHLSGEDRQQLTFSIGELIQSAKLDPHSLASPIRHELIDESIAALKKEELTTAATKTLANLDAQEAAPSLIKVLNRLFVHPILRVDAAVALLTLGHPEGEKYLGKALGSKRKDARGYALQII